MSGTGQCFDCKEFDIKVDTCGICLEDICEDCPMFDCRKCGILCCDNCSVWSDGEDGAICEKCNLKEERKSLTQKARELYTDLVGDETRVGHYESNGNQYWLAKRKRAYLVKDMPSDYVANIIRALRDRHPEVDYSVLSNELRRRVENESK